MKKFRLYYDPDRELLWLRDLMHQGWALTHFALGVYTFEPCQPDEYLYQIDLLKSADDFDNYRIFMEDSGVEVVCRWMRWVYVRKRTEDGPFALYTDTESLIHYYSSIRKFFLPLAIIETVCAVLELFAALGTGNPVFGFLILLLAFIAVVFYRMVWKCSWKIEELKRCSDSVPHL